MKKIKELGLEKEYKEWKERMLAEPLTLSDFKIGDKVEFINPNPYQHNLKGRKGTVVGFKNNEFLRVDLEGDRIGSWFPRRFKLIK